MTKFLDEIFAGKDGLSSREICIMASIAYGAFARKPYSISTLNSKYEWPQSSVSRYVSKLIELRLVCETIDPDDRRKRYLALTEKGIENHRRLCKRISNL